MGQRGCVIIQRGLYKVPTLRLRTHGANRAQRLACSSHVEAVPIEAKGAGTATRRGSGSKQRGEEGENQP